jgi:hypothetical protein
MSGNANRPDDGARERDSGTQGVTWSNFWKRPEIVVPALLAIGLGTWAAVAAAQPPPDPVAECQKNHPDAKGTPVRTEGTGQSYVVEGCAQPGTPGIAEDGLWRVELTVYPIPDTAMVDPHTQVEVYKTECPVLGVDYLYSNQGISAHTRFVLQNGQTVSGHDGKPRNIFEPGVPEEAVKASLPGDRLIVLNNGRNQLSSLSCEPLSSLP